jgi:hypothetical protein
MSTLTVSTIPKLNTLVLKQEGGTDFFVAAPNAIIISVPNLAHLILFLMKNNFISYKVIEGVLEEYHSDKGSINV